MWWADELRQQAQFVGEDEQVHDPADELEEWLSRPPVKPVGLEDPDRAAVIAQIAALTQGGVNHGASAG